MIQIFIVSVVLMAVPKRLNNIIHGGRIYKKNTNIGNDDLQGQFDDQPAVGKMDRDMIHFDTAVNDLAEVTRSSTLYLLKLQEECCLPKSTVKSVVANTKTVVQETLSVVKTQGKPRPQTTSTTFFL